MSMPDPSVLLAQPSAEIRRVLSGSPSQVFEIWTRAEHLLKWWGRWAGFTPTAIESDPRPGGAYDIRMHDAAGQHYHIWGVYEKVEVPGRLLYSWCFERLEADGTAQPGRLESQVEVLFKAHPEGTAVTIIHSILPNAAQCASVTKGWAQQLQLASDYISGGQRELADRDANELEMRAFPAERDLFFTIEIQAPASKVFEYLSQAGKLTQWFPKRAQTDPRPGGAFRFEWDFADGSVHCKLGHFNACEAPLHLSYGWYAPGFEADGTPKGPGLDQMQTVVDWRLNESAKGGAQVLFSHTGWGYGPEWNGSFEGHASGWEMYVNNLRSILEGGPDLRKKG